VLNRDLRKIGTNMNIELCNISKRFGNFKALNDLSLTVPSGQMVALLGPSGSGKTTLLRIISGLEFPGKGKVLFDGKDVTGREARKRGVGFVFQHYALFRHMTVFENVAFGLRVKPRKERLSPSEIDMRVNKLLKLVQLDWLADRLPSQLSGGQRQRVALIRALAIEPQVLLLDEPFGSLDAKVRYELRRWLRRLHDELQVTSVFVTHDQEEALEVADLVVVMNEGQIAQIGTPEEIYEHPANAFVYNFIGHVNLFHGRVEEGVVHLTDASPAAGTLEPNSKRMVIYVRPHQLDINNKPEGVSYLRARIKHINKAGPIVKLELTTPGGSAVQVEMTKERFQTLSLTEGLEVFVSPKKSEIFAEEAI
jgi:sulfate/thiosulfate transport system ATP-binding protein